MKWIKCWTSLVNVHNLSDIQIREDIANEKVNINITFWTYTFDTPALTYTLNLKEWCSDLLNNFTQRELEEALKEVSLGLMELLIDELREFDSVLIYEIVPAKFINAARDTLEFILNERDEQ